jgi:hypothetical protein
MFMLALAITIIIVYTLFRPHLTIMSYTIYMYRSVYKKNPIKIGEGDKLVWGGKWVCVNTYLVFRGENSVYTHFSGGKSQYILIFPGGETEYILMEKWVWGKNEYVTPAYRSEEVIAWNLIIIFNLRVRKIAYVIAFLCTSWSLTGKYFISTITKYIEMEEWTGKWESFWNGPIVI